jgi:hypothetical protein
MNKKNIPIYLLIGLAVGVLLYFILKDPKPTDSHKDDYDRVVAENKAFKEKEPAVLKRIDSLEAAGNKKDSAITALKTEISITRRQLDKTTTTATKLAKEVKDLSKADTTILGRKCDSLAEAAENFAYLYSEYKLFGDSLALKVDSQKVDYEKALTEQKRLYNDLKRLQDGMELISERIYKDLQAARKTIKRERLKTKIAALLGLIGGAAAVLK